MMVQDELQGMERESDVALPFYGYSYDLFATCERQILVFRNMRRTVLTRLQSCFPSLNNVSQRL